MPPTSAPDGATRTAWWLFAPPAAVVGLRWLLEWHADRWPGPAVWPLAPFDGTRDPAWALTAFGAGAAVLAATGWLLRRAARRWGRPAARRIALGLWVLACAGGAVALALRHWDARLLQPLPDARVTVAGTRPQPASLRGPGGTQVVLRWEAGEATRGGAVQGVGPDSPPPPPLLRQATLPPDAAAGWQPGQALRLQWAQGRFGGLYATGWSPAGPAASAGTAPHLP